MANWCEKYGIEQGRGIEVPQFGYGQSVGLEKE